MQLTLFIPDSPRRAWQALRYWLRVRKSPVKLYGIKQVRAEHHRALRAVAERDEMHRKYVAARSKLIDAQKELSALKRAGK